MQNVRRHRAFLLCLSLVAAACAADDPPPVAGPGASAGAGEAERDEALATTSPLVEDVDAVVSLAYLAQPPRSKPSGDALDPAGSSCATYAVSGPPLAITVTLTDCLIGPSQLPASGTIRLSAIAGGFAAVVEGLTVGDRAVEGEFSMLVDSAAQTASLNVDLLLSSPTRTTHLAGLSIVLTAAQAVVDGKVTVGDVVNGGTIAIVVAGLTQERGACLPSAGTLQFPVHMSTATVTFLPTSPEDGVFLVEVPPYPVFEVAIQGLCP